MAILQPNAIHQPQFCRISVMTQSIMLTAQHQVIRVSADDDLSCCLLPSPLVDPEVDDIMEEDICQNRADPRPLRCPHFHRFPSAALEDASLEAPLDQAENPAVGNPVRDHPQQPSVVDGIKRQGFLMPLSRTGKPTCPVRSRSPIRPIRCSAAASRSPRSAACCEPMASCS